MRPGIWKRGAVAAASAVLAISVMSGCSIAGKRVTETGWQITLLNGRQFEEGDGHYLLAFYDGALPPPERSVTVLQLWSGPRPAAEANEGE